MAQYRVAKRYAKAFMDFLNSDEKKIEVANKEMANLVTLVQESRDLQLFLKSPILDDRRKEEISKALFKSYSEPSQEFIALVMRHGRANILPQIAEEFNHLYREKHNIRKAVITSAEKLGPKQIEEIVAKAKKELSNNVTLEVENKINKDLIGGFVLRIGDMQYDASIQTQLQNLKNQFNTNPYERKF